MKDYIQWIIWRILDMYTQQNLVKLSDGIERILGIGKSEITKFG